LNPYAVGKNSVVIASAGNQNGPIGFDQQPCESIPYPCYPAQYSNVIAVSGSQQNNNFVDDWNYGSFIDVNAPGRTDANTGLWSTDLNDSYTNDVAKTSGTSFAAPQVSALASLIKSLNVSLTPDQIQTILENTADKVGQYSYTNGRNDYFGYGRINAYEAVKEAIPTKITTDITDPPSTVTWDTHVLVRKPSSGVDLYVDGVTLTIDAGAVVVVEKQVRLNAIDGGKIILESGAKIILEPAAEITAGDGGEVIDNGATIIYQGTGSCMATNGGTLEFTSGLTRTVDNGGLIAGFYPTGGTIELGDNTQLVFEDGAELMVQEGTTFKMGDDADIVVKDDATATIEGTAANPITFTAADGDPQRSEWGTIYLYGSDNTVEYTIIEGSDWGLKFYGNPSASSGNVVKNCTLSKNDQAIRAENTELEVYDTLIEDNRHAFVLISNSDIYLDGNTVKDNDRDGIYAIGSVVDVFNSTFDNNGMGNTSTIHGIWASGSSDIALGSRTWDDASPSPAGITP